MNAKTLFVGAMILSMTTGATLAGALDEPELMKSFYTDPDMKTMKADSEFKAVWAATAQNDRDRISKECGDSVTGRPHNNFCAKTKELGGAN